MRAVIALTLLVIWGHSLMNSETSAAESGSVGLFLSGLFPWLVYSDRFIRKGAHMLEYALLSSEVTLLKNETAFPRRLFGSLSFCGLAALIDETVQFIPPGRSPGVADLWFDLGGALIGALLTAAFVHAFTARKSRR